LCRNGRRECFVEGDGEGFELFAAGCVDHLDEDLGAFEGRGVGVVLEVFDVVEEIPGKSGVRSDGGGLEAEVVIVLDDLFVDVALLEGNGGEGDLGPVGGLEGEEPAVDVVEGGGWILSLFAEMNCMRTSLRSSEVSESLVTMTRTGMREWRT